MLKSNIVIASQCDVQRKSASSHFRTKFWGGVSESLLQNFSSNRTWWRAVQFSQTSRLSKNSEKIWSKRSKVPPSGRTNLLKYSQQFDLRRKSDKNGINCEHWISINSFIISFSNVPENATEFTIAFYQFNFSKIGISDCSLSTFRVIELD